MHCRNPYLYKILGKFVVLNNDKKKRIVTKEVKDDLLYVIGMGQKLG